MIAIILQCIKNGIWQDVTHANRANKLEGLHKKQDTTCITMMVGDNVYFRSSGEYKIIAVGLIVLAAYTGVNRGTTASRSIAKPRLGKLSHGQVFCIKLTSLSNK